MKTYALRAYRAQEALPHEQQLAHILATLATARTPLVEAAVDMVENRIIDNAAVAIAAINERPVRVARAMALSHPVHSYANAKGACLYGLPQQTRVSAEWAAWANGTAVRQLDFHDTFLARDYSHPADNIPPLLAIAQNIPHPLPPHLAHLEKIARPGEQLLRAILTSYEVQVALVKSISLHRHAIDHIAHLGVSMAAGLGTLLALPVETIYQAIQQTLHVTITTRQSRKGQISSWKAFAPAHAGKLAIEAIDRCLRGENAPSPIYEGEDSVIAQILGGTSAQYEINLPSAADSFTAILETYTKEHSAEYQSQAIIDLAFEVRAAIPDLTKIEKITIHTSHHTHKVIGTGSGDPEKFDPNASRETLDHSIMYIFAVALEDGSWHHIRSYTKERATRPTTIALWRKIITRDDPKWTERYHATAPSKKAFGGRVEIALNDGSVKYFEKTVANAHPNGKTPFARQQYIHKFKTLTAAILPPAEQERFLRVATSLRHADQDEICNLNITLPENKLLTRAAYDLNDRSSHGIL